MFKLLVKYTKEHKFAAIITPFLMVAEVIFDVYIPKYMTLIIKNCQDPAAFSIEYVYKTGITMVLMALAAGICGAVAGITSSVASSGFIKNIRQAIFEKVQEFSFANIEKFEVPSLLTRMTKDMRELRMAYVSIIRHLFRAPLQLIVSGIMIFSLDRSLAVIFMVAVPILGTGLVTIFMTAHPKFKKLMIKFDDLNGNLEENFIGIRVVKTFVREKYEKIKFKATSEEVMTMQRKAEKIVNFNDPFFNLVMYTCMILVCVFGGKKIIFGTMETADFMAYLSYMRRVLFSLMMISNSMMQIVFAQAAVDRANEVLNEKIDITDENCDPNLQLEDGSIKFENVSFAYSSKANTMALSDINLEIKSGETIGIIGSTGSSKTTLVQLIPRLYDTTEGNVYVGGHNVKEYSLFNLREQVAMVLQKNVLFSGTIEENLKWGDMNATHQQVEEAAKCAQADDFIKTFPDGYNTYLGQGGVNVSGGQKQRLCIARALLKKPKIIILDDSTSAVDTDTDKRIRAALKEKLSGMTTIIIAQRIASIMEADKIIVMDEGKIATIGNHEQLLKESEVYADLYRTQLQGVSE